MPHILLYGGTFDPIHHGHLITCQRAREILSADRVLFIPAHISPHKTHRTSASSEHRLAMLHAAIADHAFFLADARELDRGEREGKGGGPSYTIETIESLRHENPADRFTLLLGSDQLPKLHTWHRVGELVDMIDLAILARPTPADVHRPLPITLETPPIPIQNEPKTEQNAPQKRQSASFSIQNPLESGLDSVAKHLGPLVASRLKILHTPLIEISSTDIRERIRESLPLDFLLPPSVIAYIQLHNLYKND